MKTPKETSEASKRAEGPTVAPAQAWLKYTHDHTGTALFAFNLTERSKSVLLKNERVLKAYEGALKGLSLLVYIVEYWTKEPSKRRIVVSGEEDLQKAYDYLRKFAKELTANIEALPGPLARAAHAFISSNPAAAMALSNAEQGKRTLSKRSGFTGLVYSELPVRQETFPILTPEDEAAILRRGAECPWSKRTKRGIPYQADVFEYVRDTYRKWIPGLTQEHLAFADPDLHNYFKKRRSQVGLPKGLDIPTGADARLRAMPDPVEREKLKIVREHQRNKMRTRRSSLG
jgi:hypothetical protein